jgi:alanyl-tRNA synthetase
MLSTIVPGMPTEKLYWQDPFAKTFETAGARLGTFGGQPSVILDRTLFYAEAGGQLGDQGTLRVGGRELGVTDVQIDEAEDIHHIVPGLTAAGPEDSLDLRGTVEGTIDAARRRDHMVQHTAQHMLSRALVDAARAETVSARLGSTSCTIDVSVADIPDAALAQAADLVNAAVMDDLVVRSLFPTAAELSTLKLRREPKVTTNIRVIDIEGFDVSPCGGTHCTRTGQIGAIVIAGTERYKGKLRVSFHAGRRALADAHARQAALGALAGELTCGPLDVPAAVMKLRGELKARMEALSATRGELVELLARELLAAHPPDPSGTTRIVVGRDRDDVAMLRTLAGRIAARPDVVAFCAAPDPATGDRAVVVQRGSGTTFDCGAWLKTVTLAHGGRGGGRPERAEGRLPAACDLGKLAES